MFLGGTIKEETQRVE